MQLIEAIEALQKLDPNAQAGATKLPSPQEIREAVRLMRPYVDITSETFSFVAGELQAPLLRISPELGAALQRLRVECVRNAPPVTLSKRSAAEALATKPMDDEGFQLRALMGVLGVVSIALALFELTHPHVPGGGGGRWLTRWIYATFGYQANVAMYFGAAWFFLYRCFRSPTKDYQG